MECPNLIPVFISAVNGEGGEMSNFRGCLTLFVAGVYQVNVREYGVSPSQWSLVSD